MVAGPADAVAGKERPQVWPHPKYQLCIVRALQHLLADFAGSEEPSVEAVVGSVCLAEPSTQHRQGVGMGIHL